MPTAVTDIELPPPGIYHDVPADEYHAWPALGSTSINDLIEAPIDYLYGLGKARKATEAEAFGTTCHTAILEPHEFDKRYVARDKKDLPGGSLRSNAAKAQWQEWHDEAAELGHAVITVDEYEMASRMRDSVHQHPAASKLFKPAADCEVSVRWDTDGIPCKGRFDWMPKTEPFLADIKTTRSAHSKKFEYSIRDYGYDVQASWYLDGLTAVEEVGDGAIGRDYFIIAVEKTGPCKVSVFQLSNDFLNLARERARDGLEAYRKCSASGHWPSYSDKVIKLRAKVI